MKNYTILILGINMVSAKYLPDALKKLGHTPIFLIDSEQFNEPSRSCINNCEHYKVNIEDKEELFNFLSKNQNIIARTDFVVSFFDELFPLVDDLCKKFQLSGPPKIYSQLSSKEYISTLVPEFSPLSYALKNLETDILEEIVASDQEFILKPSVASGALGIVEVDTTSISSLNNSLSHIDNFSGWILQQNIEGDLYSLEGYVQDDVTTILGYSLRKRIQYTEVSNQYPAENSMPKTAYECCDDAIRTLISRSKFDRGYFHCEFICNQEGGWLIDANMGRVGGATVVEQIAVSHSVAPGEILTHAAFLQSKYQTTPPNYSKPENSHNTLGVWYGLKKGGVVLDWLLPAKNTCYHTKFAKKGSQVVPVGTSDYAWVGMLAGHAVDVEKYIGKVRVLTDSGTELAYY